MGCTVLMGAHSQLAIWSTLAWTEKFYNGLCTHFRLKGSRLINHRWELTLKDNANKSLTNVTVKRRWLIKTGSTVSIVTFECIKKHCIEHLHRLLSLLLIFEPHHSKYVRILFSQHLLLCTDWVVENKYIVWISFEQEICFVLETKWLLAFCWIPLNVVPWVALTTSLVITGTRIEQANFFLGNEHFWWNSMWKKFGYYEYRL